MSVPMIAITTRSSTSVKPAVRADMWGARRCMIGFLFTSTTLGHNSPPWAKTRGGPRQGFPEFEDRESVTSSQRKDTSAAIEKSYSTSPLTPSIPAAASIASIPSTCPASILSTRRP